jgi:DNA polymerase I
MSAVVASERNRDLAALRSLLHEATKLGVRFRISGGSVVIDRLGELPLSIQNELLRYRDNGLLWIYLGGEEQDLPALEFLEQLEVEAILVETLHQAVPAIRSLLRDAHRYNNTVGLDIETAPRAGLVERPWVAINRDGTLSAEQPKPEDKSGLIPHLSDIQTLQLFAGGQCCYVFRKAALRHVLKAYWFRTMVLVAHNAAFEVAFVMHHCEGRRLPHRRPRGTVHCTMQAGGLEHGVGWGRSRRLEAIAQAELGLVPPKDLQLSDWAADILSPGQIAYAASDAILAWKLWQSLPAKLQRPVGRSAAGSRWSAYELQRRVIPAVADMELRGLKIDPVVHKTQVRLWERELADANRAYLDLTGKPPPTNHPQVLMWLEQLQRADPHRFSRWPRTPGGQLSTRSAHLKRLVDVESARHVLAIRAKRQLLNAFGPKLIEHVSPRTGRVHAHYNIAGTKAGRFSAEAPNPQQLPGRRAREFKNVIIAEPGKALVCADYSQIEMRVFAWITGDPVLMRIFADPNGDIHRETAASITGNPPDHVTEAMRQSAKAVNFGAVYGIGTNGLRENAWADYGIDISEAEAERWLKRFFDRFRVANKWRYRHHDTCQARGYVEIGFGRIVRRVKKTLLPAVLQPARTGGRCRLPDGGALIYTVLREKRIRGGLVACVHDEILLEVAADAAELVRMLLEEVMTSAFIDCFPGAPVQGVVASKIGRTWAEAKA